MSIILVFPKNQNSTHQNRLPFKDKPTTALTLFAQPLRKRDYQHRLYFLHTDPQ